MTTFSERAISSDFRLEVQTVQRLLQKIDTPRSLTVFKLIEYGEWTQLVDLSIDPGCYEDHRTFALDYLATEILRKSPNLPLGIDRRGRALDAFLNAELSCWFTNLRLLEDPIPTWTENFRNQVSRLLGPLDKETLDSVQNQCRFGPGASTGVRGVGSVASDKFDKTLHMTASLIPFFRVLLGNTWWEHQSATKEVVEGNKFATVPKNAKTDRGICIEPTLNMYVQLGLGAVLRSKLNRSGIDLNRQERNQELAARAQRDGLATIDLAQASDSLSWSVILKFFPQPWAELIFLLRSEYTTLPDGDVIELGKLSSMGNGYTFELESLVFWCVVKSIVPYRELCNCSVYGDDIIVPQRYAKEVIDALNFLGFRVNGSKSFLAGNFFESCGADYFNGHNVRPFYLQGHEGEIPYALQIANALRRWSHRFGGEVECDPLFRDTWTWLVKQIPRSWRQLRVPILFGDCGVISGSDEIAHLPRPSGGFEGRLVRYRALTLTTITVRSLGLFLAKLAGNDRSLVRPWYEKPGPPGKLPNSPLSYGRQPVRGVFGKPVTRSAIVSRWPSGWNWGL